MYKPNTNRHSRGSSQGRKSSSFGSRNRGFKRGGFVASRIDISRFINKAVITEEVETFIPDHLFKDFAIDEHIKKNISAKGYEAPTPIQDKSIPHILRGEDLVGIANTGTGKTAAFLIPLIDKILQDKKGGALIVVPTRELANQIQDELRVFAKGTGLFSVVCVGGLPIGKQLRDLRYHNHFVIGTPGRLKDLIERKALTLSQYRFAVLDEADRMLDMGFIGDMKYMMALLPQDRQTLFFSATLSPDIEKLIKDFLKNPVRISVKTQETASSVEQDIVKIKGGDKVETLHELLIKPEFSKVLVFSKTKFGADKLTKELNSRGFKVESIHGDKNQSRREKALALFKDNKVQVLVATDVAARGLDISDVSHVINYDLPATYEDYVHRIGRTGRGGKRGKALTFVA